MNKITIAIFLLFASIPTFATGKKINVEKVEIKKYSYDVHMSATFKCSEYDNVFDEMIVMEQRTLDTVLYDKDVITKLYQALKNCKEFSQDGCKGRPHIKLIISLKGGGKEYFYIQGRSYVLNSNGVNILYNDWAENYLHDLGGFE